jgi:phosphoadenosine phosphosulfate reductase
MAPSNISEDSPSEASLSQHTSADHELSRSHPDVSNVEYGGIDDPLIDLSAITPPTATDPQSWTRSRIAALNAQFEPRRPEVILRWAVQTFGTGLAQGTGFGPSGIVIMHMLSQIDPDATFFFLDTDLLFPETYELKDELAETFGVTITRVHGGATPEEQAEAEGPELWNREPDRCCFLRKVKPLQEFLADQTAWVTGIRRDQSESRKQTKIVDWAPKCEVVKVNPLATWSRKDVWRYILECGLPYNELHDRGFPSIGCIPCTASVDGNEYSRDGRWEGTDKSECGIHS